MELSEKYKHIKFKRHWIVSTSLAFQLGQCDMLIKSISQLPLQPKYKDQLLSISLIKGAVATTAIEGNTLTTEDVKKIQDGQSMPPSKEYQEIEIKNILNAFNSIIRDVVGEKKFSLISPTLLKNFHKMVGKDLGEHFDAIPGKFRTDNRTVGNYRTPDYEDVEDLIKQLCNWLKNDFEVNNNQNYYDAIIKAIVAHIYIEWIHPFADGNGRTGRLIEFFVLLRTGTPVIASHILSNFYNETRTEYYRQFENARRKQDLTDFIAYAVQGYRDGLVQTFNIIRDSLFDISWQKLIYDSFTEKKYSSRQVFKRRRNLMLNIQVDTAYSLDEIVLINPKIAREYANISERTVLRDLKELENLNLLIKVGNKYIANTQLLAHLIPSSKEV